MRHAIQSAARLFAVLFISTSSFAAALVPTGTSVPGEVLVKVRAGISQDEIASLKALAGADEAQRLSALSSGTILRLHSRTKNVQDLTQLLHGKPNVVYVEPNYILRLAATPNDPSYSQLWGLKNSGQSILGSPGSAGSDIDAEAAWNVTTGSASIVVGVIDTGVNYNHPDLAANMWSNPGGKGNAACGAGTHGFNAITMTCDPMDDHYHGTHVSGTIGAVGNNGVGVAGVNWTTSIMALKFLGSSGYGTTAGAIIAIEFAVQAKIDGVNVRVLSNSWGGGGFSKALLDEINWANQNDILFVAAAGNDGMNNDFYPHYPSNYATPNMISVAATDNRDATAYFTNYGLTTVHLGAPGVNILSCDLGTGYTTVSGTSMATPHVAGVAALILAHTPSLTTAQVKSAILNNTDAVASLTGKTITGGRLNAARALGLPATPEFTISANPTSRAVLQDSSTSYTITVTPSGGFAGSVDFSVSDLPSGATASFNPTSSATGSTLTITTSPSTPLGDSFPVITGVSGALTRTITVNLYTTTTPPAQPCPSFGQNGHYSLNDSTAMVLGDFNRDGRMDIAHTNVTSNRVYIRFGSGNGTFSTGGSFSAGLVPLAVTAADFNGDGKLDLATANSGSHNVSVLLGNGDGTFQTAAAYGAGTSPFAIAAGDFDHDGASDLAVANNGSSNVSVLLGQGNGTFASAVHYNTGTGPFGVTVADFDRDGSTDLAVANYRADSVSILTGNGDGTFDTAVDYAVAHRPSAVDAGDFNVDGIIDLATSNFGSANVSILTGAGNGTFGAAANYPAGTNPYSVTTGDFNTDGQTDLTVANNSGGISVLMGSGNGTFQAPISITVGFEPKQVSTADFNGDGKSDLAALSGAGITILMNTGTCSVSCGTIAAPAQHVVGGNPYGLATGDFNRDGNVDAAVSARTTNNVSIALGNGDGTFYAGVAIGVGPNPDAATAADFNHDGNLDLALVISGGDAEVLLGNGDGTFQTPVLNGMAPGASSIAAADFDRDGNADLYSASGGSGVAVRLGNGDGTFEPALNFLTGSSPIHAAAGDFNRDGKPDLAVANDFSGNVSILLGNGDGTFQSAVHFGAGTNPRSAVSTDLNRDGKEDLVVVNNGSNDVSILLGNGSGSFLTAVQYAAGTGPANATAGDFNDDGTLDLAVANHGSNNVSILAGLGAGAFAPAVHSAAGSGPVAIAAADFDGDGKPDLATASSGSGSMSILRNTCPVPDLTITKSHAGTFTQGSTGKTYTIIVTNGGAAPTDGVVSVTDLLPIGLSATGMSGTGWTCTPGTLTCTRNDVLGPAASYPPLTLTVNVASGAPASVTNTVIVAGGGEVNTLNNSASDVTAVAPATDLIATLTHAGSFAQGAVGKTYTIIVRNAGGLPTAGTVTVSDTLPTGLTATAISGTGWACTLGTLTCTRSNVLAGSTSYPAITLTVNVAANAPANFVNTATVSGGGDTNAANNTATDPTVVWSTNTCGSFGAPVFYPVGSSPRAVVAGNINGDAAADLVVASSYPSSISVLAGNGNGTFQSAVDTPVIDSPEALAIGDMDNDGKTDVVLATGYYGRIKVLLGTGTGTFAPPISYDIGSEPYALALADFNNDGHRDVVVTNQYTSTVSILLGNGNGTLQEPLTHTLPSYTAGVAVSDFDGNGVADLAVTTSSDGVAILLGNGNGTFQSTTGLGDFTYSSSITAGDFNHDGKIDLAAAEYYDGVAIMLGNGNGTFQTPVHYESTYGAVFVATDDVNGDSKADLVLVSSSSYAASTLFGNGDGTFQPANHYYAGSGPSTTAIGDFNGDGRADLALNSSYSSYVGILLGGCADLSITKSHSGNFAAGQSNAQYSLTVTNSGNGTTTGPVTVTDLLPSGLTATYISGSWQWDCELGTLTCTSTEALPAGESYYPINVWVDVAGNAPSNVVNTATVSGGGDNNTANNSASDPTTIVQAADLSISKTHSGMFVQGDTGRTYTLVVTNSGTVATHGMINVYDYMPSGLVATAISGTGWNCVLGLNTCSRSDSLAPGASYPPITITVNVYTWAPSSVTNYAEVYGGGELINGTNNAASDYTQILTTPNYPTALPTSASQVYIVWNAVSHATGYDVLRSTGNGPYVQIATAFAQYYHDDSVSPNTVYLYKIRARHESLVSPAGNADLVTTIIFTDDLSAGTTKMKAVHITELRTAVNLVRAAAGLPPAVLTDPVLTAGTFIKAAHITELRANLDQARAVFGLIPTWYYEPTIPIGSRIKAAHILELRGGVQ